MPQESFLFSATIAENIALARPDASRAEIEGAARMAAIHDDILRFPYGYDTPVGEKGITLSGGQRQRVAIARALLADNPLLLLDDALSAVDTGTETRILEHLAELRRARPERAAIIASHRLSAVVEADHIVVLRDGRIIEAGHPRRTACCWMAGTPASGAINNWRPALMQPEATLTQPTHPPPRRRSRPITPERGMRARPGWPCACCAAPPAPDRAT